MAEEAKEEDVQSVEAEVMDEADPSQGRGCLNNGFAYGGILLSILYLLNLSGGFIEIPDNLPLFGNIDEAAATAILLGCLRYLGVDILPFKPPPKN